MRYRRYNRIVGGDHRYRRDRKDRCDHWGRRYWVRRYWKNQTNRRVHRNRKDSKGFEG